jgi:hypothetical protein
MGKVDSAKTLNGKNCISEFFLHSAWRLGLKLHSCFVILNDKSQKKMARALNRTRRLTHVQPSGKESALVKRDVRC